MPSPLRILAALVPSVLLGACGFMTPARQYAGDPRPPSEVALIQSYLGSAFGGEVHATISGFARRPEGSPAEVRRFGWPGFTDYPREIELAPGDYVLELYCFTTLGQPTYRPTLEVTVQAGTAYTVKCDAAAGRATAFVSQAMRRL